MSLNKNSKKRTKTKGQAFVELALVMPVFIIMLAGMAEVVVIFNDYLQMLDAVRAGARYTSDKNPYPTSATNPGEYDILPWCTKEQADAASAAAVTAVGGVRAPTEHFFRRAACDTIYSLSFINLRPGSGGGRTNTGGNCTNPSLPQDDVVVSVFGTHVWDNPADSVSGLVIDITRFDNNSWNGTTGSLVADDAGSLGGANSGWSYMADQYGTGVAGMCSRFTTAQMQSFLLDTAPSTGIVLIEIFYNHYQIFDMPVFGDIIPNPTPLHSYAFFPLVSAEPTSTPSS